MEQLEALALEKELGLIEEVEKKEEGWTITDYRGAEWAMDTYYLADMRIKSRTDFVKARVEAVLDRLDKMCTEDAKTKGVMGDALKAWGVEFLKKQKTKTIKLIHGKMSYKDVPEAVVIDDQVSLVSDIISKRSDAEFLAKNGTVPLKVELSFVEPSVMVNETVKIQEVQGVVASFVERLQRVGVSVKVETTASHANVKTLYEDKVILFAGCHVRPKLFNATFKIVPTIEEIMDDTGTGEDNGSK